MRAGAGAGGSLAEQPRTAASPGRGVSSSIVHGAPFDIMKKVLIMTGCAVFLVCLLATPLPVHGYSVLSHEAVVDTLWDPSIKPLLLKRYPTASEAQLQEAHAYAYGGCIIQDMGYYPFGSRLFSDLTHYVRSGDFIRTLIEESHDMYEFAFALGALAHYASDNSGHP